MKMVRLDWASVGNQDLFGKRSPHPPLRPILTFVLIDELELRAYFAAIVTGYDLPGKPDPTLFLKAARQIDVPPERCVVVEDAVAGVEAAKRAGMKCIAVTTTNPAQALDEADVVVERLDELPPDTIKRLLGA
jgi:beta-phosphoglucomutase-like phosphatase (HAD superfamily)